ncbi:MACPF domain-containing protein At4g24290-like [Lolium perenne]|uniref:MACPF domain-containing protein At4g24290-like n=1 Tax=Lolium perenne TaxID=4522 RepID=UPI0021F5603E|nr:MACPF domain-containing protein At4g24290-like [Lolium perenne]
MAARRLELPRNAAESAVRSIGLGYDVAADVRLKFCKQRGEPLIELDRDGVQDIVLPGSLTVAGVPKSIKCDKGERMRFRSDVLSFQQAMWPWGGSCIQGQCRAPSVIELYLRLLISCC